MEWVTSTLHITSERGVSSITTADAHNSAGSSRLNWRTRWFKRTRPFRPKKKSCFYACVITFQLASTLVLFQGWGVKYCWNRWSSNFSFRNKFVIVLPRCLLVDNNTFSEMCVFKSLAGYIDDGCYENRKAYVLITVKWKVMQRLCWLF